MGQFNLKFSFKKILSKCLSLFHYSIEQKKTVCSDVRKQNFPFVKSHYWRDMNRNVNSCMKTPQRPVKNLERCSINRIYIFVQNVLKKCAGD